MNKFNTIIFDFDGTLVDSFDISCEIIHELALKYGKIDMSLNEIKEFIRNKNLKDIIAEFKINKFQLFFILIKAQYEFHKKLKSIKFFEDVENMIKKLKKNGFNVGIVSSNSKTNIEDYLEDKNMKDEFDFVYKTSLFNKANTLKKVINNLKIEMNEVLYVGDEIRDLIASKSIGLSCVSVSWGFNSEKLLISKKPKYLVANIDELEKIIYSN